MAETLFITPSEITGTTVMGGNVDVEKYITNIAFVQVTIIEPLLGTELYDKITEDFKNDDLIGNYLIIFNDYIKPITKFSAVAEYIQIANLNLDNSGVSKHTSENAQIPTSDEISLLSGKYSSMAQMHIQRFNKWISYNNIAEYKNSQDEVNAQRVNQRSGFYFGNETGISWKDTEVIIQNRKSRND